MNSFASKVAAERAILQIVNQRTPGARQLAGMSWKAIDAWQRVVGLTAKDPLVEELKALSDMCQRLSDRSHETFQNIDPQLAEAVSQRSEALGKLVLERVPN